MLKKIATFGGWTLVSRVLGFVRDVLMAAVLGAGPVADAFFVAFRLPNHFRALLGEGAFSVAFVPTFSRTLAQKGIEAAKVFEGRISSLLLIINLVLFAGVLLFTASFLGVFAPGLTAGDVRMGLAIEFTQITFGFLLLVTLTSLYVGVLNASGKFGLGAAVPIVLNVVLIGAMLLATYFVSAGHAASYGVLLAGVLELVLVMFGVHRLGLLAWPTLPKIGENEKQFFKAFLPAIIGSAGVQVAMFADTLLATFMPTGSVSALYYADRLYQLPVGILGVAVGTVLLGESARKIAKGQEEAAQNYLRSSLLLLVLLAVPATLVFLFFPDLLMRTLFMRGAFDASAAGQAASILFAYALGLPAVLLIRAFVTPFQARGDTLTPLKISLFALLVNVCAKFYLTPLYGVSGLAMATSIGAWLNLIGLMILCEKHYPLAEKKSVLFGALWILMAGAVLAVFWYYTQGLIGGMFGWADWHKLLFLLTAGAFVYVLAAAPAVVKFLWVFKR